MTTPTGDYAASDIPPSELTVDAVRAALEKVMEPKQLKSLIELNMVDNIAACDGMVKVDLILPSTDYEHRDTLFKAVREAVEMMQGVKQVTVGISLKTPPKSAPFQRPDRPVAPVAGKQLLPNVKNIIAISSGKGGVGKTSTSVNLACALSQLGYQVGILDADVYGPNVPIMMGLRGQMPFKENKELGKPMPPENHGVKIMSIGFLVKEEQPVVWRGPMLDKLIRQFLSDFDWGDLDFLLIDLPPGTGDAQLTIMQAASLSGAIIVTTPQEVALHDSRKGLAMFVSQNIPVLGIVENMSYFEGDDGKRYEIFGHGGGRNAAQALNVPFLGEVPMIIEQREQADLGQPVAVYDPQGKQAGIYRALAEQMVQNLQTLAKTPTPA